MDKQIFILFGVSDNEPSTGLPPPNLPPHHQDQSGGGGGIF